MSIELTYDLKPDHLIARFGGQGQAEEIPLQFQAIVEQCNQAGLRRALIDISAVQVKLTFMDRVRMAENGVIFARSGIRLAFVGLPEQAHPERIGELMAQNRGVDVKIFTDIQVAEDWLLHGK